MVILGIETSCDETSVAIIKGADERSDGARLLDRRGRTNLKIISNKLASSLSLHSKTGGIIPEIAAREQVKYIIPVLEETLKEASQNKMVNSQRSIVNNIDAIAVTVGPGLIGSLLVGVETARTLAYLWKKPIVPVNHLIGHIYANFISEIHNSEFMIHNSAADVQFPAMALIVSGGHTDLVLIKNHGSIKWLGGTRDDAAGEAFDKIGRLLNLPYPGGPAIEKAAGRGNPKAFKFPRPMIDSDDFDFSFSGLKTAVFREVKAIKQPVSPAGGLNNETITDISASVQQAIVDVLIYKTLKAAKKYKVRSILLGGGVAANSKLRERFQSSIVNNKLSMKFFVPPKNLCTDNAAMIAAAAFYDYKPTDWKNIIANPELYFY